MTKFLHADFIRPDRIRNMEKGCTVSWIPNIWAAKHQQLNTPLSLLEFSWAATKNRKNNTDSSGYFFVLLLN